MSAQPRRHSSRPGPLRPPRNSSPQRIDSLDEPFLTLFENDDFDEQDAAHCSDSLTVWKDEEGEVAAVKNKEGNMYVVECMLGSGATSVVYRVIDAQGRRFAMKVVPRGRYVQAETKALEMLQHPNVVRLVDTARDERYRRVFLFFELIDGGDLCDLTPEGELVGDRWTEREARRVMLDLAASVAHLHQNDVVHRDIKPQNCLRRQTGEVVLCDFGASELPVAGDDSTRRTAGTPFFHPPEACSGKCFGAKGQDVWALGVTLYVLLFGRVPFGFGARNIIELSERLEADKLELDVPGVDISPDCREFLEHTLEKDMTRRFGLRDIMHHQWIIREWNPMASPMVRRDVCKQMMSVQGSESPMMEMSYWRNKDSLECKFLPASRQSTSRTIGSDDDSDDDSVGLPPSVAREPQKNKRLLVAIGEPQERKHLVRRIEAVTKDSQNQIVDSCGDMVLSELSRGPRYSVVFFPMHLFATDALGLTHAIREWESKQPGNMPRMKLVVAARAMTHAQSQAVLEAGADDVLLIPARLGKLQKILSNAGWQTKSKSDVDRKSLYDSKFAYDSQCFVRDALCPTPQSPTAPVIFPAPPSGAIPSYRRKVSKTEPQFSSPEAESELAVVPCVLDQSPLGTPEPVVRTSDKRVNTSHVASPRLPSHPRSEGRSSGGMTSEVCSSRQTANTTRSFVGRLRSAIRSQNKEGEEEWFLI
eukprot:Hpha_TRINITY_DN13294_c0_g2::TRINITY_DN13294_c0_g2_i1::g.154860::m.154860/K07359/CAMKK2; calcium/calmodulin-dependent protein kinase kinase 2